MKVASREVELNNLEAFIILFLSTLMIVII